MKSIEFVVGSVLAKSTLLEVAKKIRDLSDAWVTQHYLKRSLSSAYQIHYEII